MGSGSEQAGFPGGRAGPRQAAEGLPGLASDSGDAGHRLGETPRAHERAVAAGPGLPRERGGG